MAKKTKKEMVADLLKEMNSIVDEITSLGIKFYPKDDYHTEFLHHGFFGRFELIDERGKVPVLLYRFGTYSDQKFLQTTGMVFLPEKMIVINQKNKNLPDEANDFRYKTYLSNVFKNGVMQDLEEVLKSKNNLEVVKIHDARSLQELLHEGAMVMVGINVDALIDRIEENQIVLQNSLTEVYDPEIEMLEQYSGKQLSGPVLLVKYSEFDKSYKRSELEYLLHASSLEDLMHGDIG